MEPGPPARRTAGGPARPRRRGGPLRPGLRHRPLHGGVPAAGADCAVAGGDRGAQARPIGRATRGAPVVRRRSGADRGGAVSSSEAGDPASDRSKARSAAPARGGRAVHLPVLPRSRRLPDGHGRTLRPRCVGAVRHHLLDAAALSARARRGADPVAARPRRRGRRSRGRGAGSPRAITPSSTPTSRCTSCARCAASGSAWSPAAWPSRRASGCAGPACGTPTAWRGAAPRAWSSPPANEAAGGLSRQGLIRIRQLCPGSVRPPRFRALRRRQGDSRQRPCDGASRFGPGGRRRTPPWLREPHLYLRPAVTRLPTGHDMMGRCRRPVCGRASGGLPA